MRSAKETSSKTAPGGMSFPALRGCLFRLYYHILDTMATLTNILSLAALIIALAAIINVFRKG